MAATSSSFSTKHVWTTDEGWGQSLPDPPTSITIKEGPSAKEWGRHRDTIKRLYVDKGRPLKEVMSIMAQDHGLVGSVKMFKSRITQWKLDKKNKEHEMAIVLRKKAQRDAVGKASTFRIRGKPVPIEEIFRYLKRKAARDPSFRAASLEVATPSDISCHTPGDSSWLLHSLDRTPREWNEMNFEHQSQHIQDDIDVSGNPELRILNHVAGGQISTSHLNFQGSNHGLEQGVPQTISPPALYLVPEMLFAKVREYHLGWLDAKIWIENECGVLCLTQKRTDRHFEFRETCLAGINFLNQGSLVEGRTSLSKACGLMQEILQYRHPSTLRHVLATFHYLFRSGYGEILHLMCDYVGKLAAQILQSEDPWRQLWVLLSQASHVSFDEMSTQAWNWANDALSLRLGRLHKDVVYSQAELIYQEALFRKDYATSERQLRNLQKECDQQFGNLDTRSVDISLLLADIFRYQRRFTEAETIIESLGLRTEHSKGLTIELACLIRFAWLQFDQAKVDLATTTMVITISLMERVGGPESQTIYCKYTLEGWLRGMRSRGRSQSAPDRDHGVHGSG